MSGRYDLGYKQLFAHPELVRELLTQFTPCTWLAALEVSAFERVNPSYVGEHKAERQDDLVWRVRCGADWVYIYILLEFQSNIDRWMALRMQVYVGLLYQDLVKRHELAPGHKLPAVLPLVFYNGATPWSAALELSQMIVPAPDGLHGLQAAQRYLLVDQQRLDPNALEAHGSLLALLFKLELSEATTVLPDVLASLSAWFADVAQEPLRRSVLLWLEDVVAREMPGVPVEQVILGHGGHMAARKYATWLDCWKDEGRQIGLELGKLEGMELGKAEGKELGKAEGKELGKAEGKAEGQRHALVKVIEARFGALPPATAQIVADIPNDDLERWIVKAASAPSLQALADGAAPSAHHAS
ncbi:Rpn family recombination-promoting nuclease/putative transposase [Massilia sp. CF038]|uniref:Rpn family recombination-promoting nuclease/putative transposase n=1 Tax=Massilia sp. CF038 TaxID=1881045 RepID=UPI00091DE94B|nr:Rpn family recombination-promoting nuclease/putative transposase [Massilia sp. CF038]SHH61008.1 Predicted transposase YdaD [Massilia sp. CF038]